MPRASLIDSGFRNMWMVAMFDLPVQTKVERRAAARFRKMLQREGFSMLQLSVYARYCGSEESAKTFRNRIGKSLPKDGNIRLIKITDHQFGKMESFIGKKPVENESTPNQLELF
ncbi:CRISPR-associated endonuclease Cas2 [Calycomorphotria hydatis]|uniref:CRISPR-associated endoribonuclease Cas2 n=1 Tax=Calycomorphotria hydatis TaxID=2528027 RepID=A0A517TA69_9PLAN|nr:CRISPR-associated endonuclease Cas2 [Calycomorphotria hydatis]QDT65270.1 CRISPR-associated endoribonuclease Cas2 [Calycomorphotria hydatis]